MPEHREMEIFDNLDNSDPHAEREMDTVTGLLPTFWQRFLEVRDYMSKKVADNSAPVEIGIPVEEDLG